MNRTPQFKMVFLELTNGCNFSCAFCAKHKMSRPVGFMDAALAMRILDQLQEHELTNRVAFHVMGEPLLHPRFGEILAYAHSVGLKVAINTNGSLLSEERNDMLLEHADRVLISLRSRSEAAFSRNAGSKRVCDYSSYISRVGQLITKKLELGTGPKIYLRLFANDCSDPLFAESVSQSHEFIRKLNTVLRQRVLPSGSIEIYPDVRVVFDKLTEFWLPSTTGKYYRSYWGKCDALTDELAILWNGDVTTCCYDYDGLNRFGNLVNNGILEVVAGDEFRNYLVSFAKMKLPTPVCQECFGASSRWRWMLRQLYSLGQFINLFPPKSFL